MSGENLQKEISELFGEALLDPDGNPIEGTGLAQSTLDNMEFNRKTDKAKHNRRNYYTYNDYWFNYDWRLDPVAIADDFHQYVEDIKTATGKPKVSIIATCLGTNVVMAYIAKYGTDSIHGVGFDGGVVNGAEILSETISGKFKVDGDAINRAFLDCAAYGWFDVGSFVISTIDLAQKSGLIDGAVSFTKETLYYKLVEGVTSALALSTFFTWPNYWAAVTTEDYEDALNYVFGPEGSEKRTEYAGLIEKIEGYNTLVRKNIPEIVSGLEGEGVKVAFIAKYGSQMIPICESANLVADQFASVTRVSFGATTSTIFETLSDEYIAQREQEGKGKYISPDKQIDASTCIYPDYTFFIKGATHSNWTPHEMKILYDMVTADTQLTTEDFPQYSQYFIYREGDGAYKMTEENCHTESWEAKENVSFTENRAVFLIRAITSLLRWFVELIKLFEGRAVVAA